MKRKIAILLGTLFLVTFVSLFSTQKAAAQDQLCISVNVWADPSNDLPTYYYVSASLNQPISAYAYVSGEAWIGGHKIPFSISISPGSTNSDTQQIFSHTEDNLDIRDVLIRSYSPTTWNGISVIVLK